jgi:hypothetical protein
MHVSNRKNHVRRAFLRRSANASVKATVRKNGNENTSPNLTAVILDLSEAGARLLIAIPLEVGAEVILGLEETTNQSLLTGQGKVVWSFRATKRAYAVGVRFDEHLDSAEIQQITIPTARLDY